MKYKQIGDYRLTEKLGYGAFGEVYKAIDISDKTQLALKIGANRGIKHRYLRHEKNMYALLSGIEQIPEIYSYRKLLIRHPEDPKKNVIKSMIAMELMGPNLEDLFKRNGKNFGLKTVLNIAKQMLCIIEEIHKRGIIHRDIKPPNMAIGGTEETCHLVYLMDFGLAKPFLDKTGKHIPFKSGKKIIAGTPRFVSIKTHEGVDQCRKDDLECLGYTLLYFLLGYLPWSKIQCEDLKERDILIYQSKKSTIKTVLDEVPSAFKKYFQYIWSLSFEEEPNYFYLWKIFDTLYKQEGYAED